MNYNSSNYLEWYKELLVKLYNDPGAKSLLSSSVPEPMETLHTRFLTKHQVLVEGTENFCTQ